LGYNSIYMKRLRRTFFNRSTLIVAEELLGKILVFKNHKGIITETEAYMGFDDPASHAARGKTKRTEIMFGPPGYSYVYLIYGLYHCLNVVTEKEGFPAAVLIRGLLVQDQKTGKDIHLDGPGKICRYLGITTQDHNKIDIVKNEDFYVGCVKKTLGFKTTSRIGIRVGQDKLWRFVGEF